MARDAYAAMLQRARPWGVGRMRQIWSHGKNETITLARRRRMADAPAAWEDAQGESQNT